MATKKREQILKDQRTEDFAEEAGRVARSYSKLHSSLLALQDTRPREVQYNKNHTASPLLIIQITSWS